MDKPYPGTLNMDFRPTAGQLKQVEMMASDATHCMTYGGTGSAKTFGWCAVLANRAIAVPSTHLIVRRHFKDCRQSIVVDPKATFPAVMSLVFPGIPWGVNRSDWFITLPSRGGESTIWLGGLDDAERAEKVLGREYATILVNEASEFQDYNSIVTLRTRLRQKTLPRRKMLYDQNPPVKSHWTYKEFERHEMPGEQGAALPNPEDYASAMLHPKENAANLGEEYIHMLESMPERQRKRFLDGEYGDDAEGALWNSSMIRRLDEPDTDLVRVVIGVDPATTSGADSDETGIVVAAQGANGRYYVLADYSHVMHVSKWTAVVVGAFHEHGANMVVAETNQGGDLVENGLVHAAGGAACPYTGVHAKRGKRLRAEPVAVLYSRGLVTHVGPFRIMEDEMTTYTGTPGEDSPNRLDALVYALSWLAGLDLGIASANAISRAATPPPED